MKEAPLFAFAQRLNMMKKGNEKEVFSMPISKKMSGFRWALEQALRRFLTLAGAVLLAWLLAPKEQPPRRVYLLGRPVSAEYGGIALPVENQALARDIRRLVNSLRYDDLQDLYPSLGQWPDRAVDFDQSQPVISFQAGGYTLELFQTERPQAILSKTDGQGKAIWRDFYRTEQIDLLEKLIALNEKIRQQGPPL